MNFKDYQGVKSEKIRSLISLIAAHTNFYFGLHQDRNHKNNICICVGDTGFCAYAAWYLDIA